MTLDLDRPPLALRDPVTADAGKSGALPQQLAGISLRNGVLRVLSKSRGLDTIIENVQGRIDGFASGAIRLNVSAIWRDAPIAISASLDSLERVERGEAERPRSRARLADRQPVFQRRPSWWRAPGVEAEVSASVPSIKALARFVGRDPPSFLAADDLAVAAKLEASTGNGRRLRTRR